MDFLKPCLSLLMITQACLLFAQKNITANKTDTAISVKVPVLFQKSIIFSTKQIGLQAGIYKTILQKENHVIKISGKKRIQSTIHYLSGNLGYYYQPQLHHNWFITAGYTTLKANKRGFYRQFTPMLGISRTFLTAATYKAADNGTVNKVNGAGSWYVISGFTAGLGKMYQQPKFKVLKSIGINLATQILYPNFKFISLKPFFTLQTIWQLNNLTTLSVKKIKLINKHAKK